MFQTLGHAAARRRWWVVALWAGVLLLALPYSFSLIRVLNATGQGAPGSPSARAKALWESRFPATRHATTLVVFHRGARPLDALDQLAIRQAARQLKDAAAVHKVTGPYFSPHRHLAYLDVILHARHTVQGEHSVPSLRRRLARVHLPQALTVRLTGDAPLSYAFDHTVMADLGRAERWTLPVTFLALVLIFGSLAAAMVPLISAFAGITLGLAALYALHSFLPLTSNVQEAAAMIGLGVGIDYSLLLVTRFRREVRGGRTTRDAAAATMATAGEAVAFSGLVVLATNLALSTINQPLLASLALGVAAAVAFTLLASLTLTPALLACLGPGLEWPAALGRLRRRVSWGRGMWEGLARRIMHRPWAVLLGAVAFLVLLALPAAGLRLWEPGSAALPAASRARQGYQLYTAAFGAGSMGPLVLTLRTSSRISSPRVLSDLRRLERDLGKLSDVKKVRGLTDLSAATLRGLPTMSRRPAALKTLLGSHDHTTLVWVYPKSPPSSQASLALVGRVRRFLSGFHGLDGQVLVGGGAAQTADVVSRIRTSAPFVVVSVMLLSYLLLFALFRSVLLPLKAVLLTLLSTLAAYGFLVLVFQDGYGAALLGFHSPGAVTWEAPPLIFAVLFGLSTDYEVFLLSRIRERYRASGDNRESVVRGLEETAGLITSAAFLMVSVFVVFGFSQLEFMKEMGLGMAFAVVLDATVIRTLLVPASMAILGPWNWWLPGRRPKRPPLAPEGGTKR